MVESSLSDYRFTYSCNAFQFYNLMEDSIGFYRPLKKDSVRVEMKYVSFNGSYDEKAVHGIFVESE